MHLITLLVTGLVTTQTLLAAPMSDRNVIPPAQALSQNTGSVHKLIWPAPLTEPYERFARLIVTTMYVIYQHDTAGPERSLQPHLSEIQKAAQRRGIDVNNLFRGAGVVFDRSVLDYDGQASLPRNIHLGDHATACLMIMAPQMDPDWSSWFPFSLEKPDESPRSWISRHFPNINMSIRVTDTQIQAFEWVRYPKKLEPHLKNRAEMLDVTLHTIYTTNGVKPYTYPSAGWESGNIFQIIRVLYSMAAPEATKDFVDKGLATFVEHTIGYARYARGPNDAKHGKTRSVYLAVFSCLVGGYALHREDYLTPIDKELWKTVPREMGQSSPTTLNNRWSSIENVLKYHKAQAQNLLTAQTTGMKGKERATPQ